MDCHGLEVVSFAQAHHLVALRTAQLIRCPLARAGGEDLECVATQPIGAFGGILDASGARGVNANTARGQAGWSPGSGVVEDVLLVSHGTRHVEKYSGASTWVCDACGFDDRLESLEV